HRRPVDRGGRANRLHAPAVRAVRAVGHRVVAAGGLAPVVVAAHARIIVAPAAVAADPATVPPVTVMAAVVAVAVAELLAVGQVVVLGEALAALGLGAGVALRLDTFGRAGAALRDARRALRQAGALGHAGAALGAATDADALRAAATATLGAGR